ncbi:TATA-binding protein-associated factor 2N-like [Protopterus annectens]|uniref:TATA-binding protein-associated factor 2N-like n=1 Tax=Protopterus annectens TaxID=7888 RepID=UPI001CFAA2EC|nr:TATA-binding protein-associated factor 2N-like [Protopterus annectens]
MVQYCSKPIFVKDYNYGLPQGYDHSAPDDLRFGVDSASSYNSRRDVPDHLPVGYDIDQPYSGYNSDQARLGYGSDQARLGYGSDQARLGYGSDQARLGYGSDQARLGYGSDQARLGYGTSSSYSWK